MIYAYICKLDEIYYFIDAMSNNDNEFSYHENYRCLYTKLDIEMESMTPFVGLPISKLGNIDLVMSGIRLFKKEELNSLSSKLSQQYIEHDKYKQNYYNLLEKELYAYTLTNKSQYLDKLAAKKDISVEKLIVIIADKIAKHNEVIFNFKHFVDDLYTKIDTLDIDGLHDLHLFEELNQFFADDTKTFTEDDINNIAIKEKTNKTRKVPKI